jgi:glycosyltransferase involved in cell wall biosynthesis
MSRILHLIHSTAFGGGPAMVDLICTRLRGSEFQMSLVSDGDGELPQRLAALGVRVTSLPLTSKGSFARSIPKLAGVIRRESPDLVHVHGHWAASLGQIAVQLAGRFPTIYSVQWPAYLDDTNAYSRVRNWIAERLSCGLAARVVAVSENDRQTLVRRRLCPSGKLTVIHNTYDPARFGDPAEAVAVPARPPNGAVLGFVGRLADQKGCEYLVKAMPDVLEAFPRTRLVIVGDGPDRRKLESLTTALHLSPAIEFRGYQPSSAALLRTMDALIVPSIYDVHPLVAVEAMACGLPIVASAVGGLRETVEDGRTGILVAPADVAGLAAGIKRLLASRPGWAGMGEAARRRVAEQVSPQVCLSAYAAEYRALGARTR